MVNTTVLFRVPIYRESKTEYYHYLETQRTRHIEEQVHYLRRLGIDPAGTEERRIQEETPFNPQGISWEYNRIIGWIEFYADGGIIKTDLWFIKAKRISREVKNKVFVCRRKISDVVSTYDLENTEIREAVRIYLNDLQQGKYGFSFLKKYQIESSWLLRNLEYLDIKTLIQDIIEQQISEIQS